jgi:hypothetical protein
MPCRVWQRLHLGQRIDPVVTYRGSAPYLDL